MHNDNIQQTNTEHDDVQGYGGSGGVQWRQGMQPFIGPSGVGGEVRTIVQPFAIRSGNSGGFGVGVQPFASKPTNSGDIW